jgi:hypothetical protein
MVAQNSTTLPKIGHLSVNNMVSKSRWFSITTFREPLNCLCNLVGKRRYFTASRRQMDLLPEARVSPLFFFCKIWEEGGSIVTKSNLWTGRPIQVGDLRGEGPWDFGLKKNRLQNHERHMVKIQCRLNPYILRHWPVFRNDFFSEKISVTDMPFCKTTGIMSDRLIAHINL